MDYTTSVWEGFKRIDFEFEGKGAIVVFPKTEIKGNK